MFPRKLNPLEQSALFKLLPENKPGYFLYREKIKSYFVVGKGRFEKSNFVLGRADSIPDNSISSAPVLAAGTIYFNKINYDLVIHEQKNDQIEIDLDGLDTIDFGNGKDFTLEGWSYSDWNPGRPAPSDNAPVREVQIQKGEYVLAISPSHKKIWLHNSGDQINHLIPLTNFYNELMFVKRSKGQIKPDNIFKELVNFTDAELISAFVNYNRYLNKFNISIEPEIIANKKKNWLFNIFSRKR